LLFKNIKVKKQKKEDENFIEGEYEDKDDKK